MGYCFNCSPGVSTKIAEHEAVWFYLDQNIFQEYAYVVSDVLGGTFEEFPFSRWNAEGQRRAYAEAAALYNSLVPAGEAIPTF